MGLGGAGFPTHVKLTPKDENAIDYVIVNVAECEPYLTSDYRMMMEEPERLVGGLKVMLALFDNAKGVIGVETVSYTHLDVYKRQSTTCAWWSTSPKSLTTPAWAWRI